MVNIEISVLEGSIGGTSVVVDLSTNEGTATGQWACRRASLL